jgi:uncharacterized protein
MFRILQPTVLPETELIMKRDRRAMPVVERPPHATGKFEQLADWVFLRKRGDGYLLIRSYPFNVVAIRPDEVDAVRRFFAGQGQLGAQLISELQIAHMFDGVPDATVGQLTRHVSAILLVTTACNLTCSHCFASGGDYGLGRAHMSSEVIDATVSYLGKQIQRLYRDQAYAGNAELGMHFFGGEPLIAFDNIQYAVGKSEAAARQLSDDLGRNVRPDFFVTTNATLLNPQRIDFLKEHGFMVLVSIDGPDHDARRQYRSGQGSLAKAIQSFQSLRAAGVPLRLNTVIRNTDVPQIRDILNWFQTEVYQNESSAAIYHTFSFEREGPAHTVGSCGNAYLGSDIEKYVGELKTFDASGFQLYEIALRNKLMTGGTFYKCSSGVKRIAIGPSGRVYPCQGFIDTKLDMGSILDPDYDHRESQVSQCMAARNIATLLPCRNCAFSALCPHNVDCAARAHYTLGGISQIDVDGMCRIGFELMDTILFENDLLGKLAASQYTLSEK